MNSIIAPLQSLHVINCDYYMLMGCGLAPLRETSVHLSVLCVLPHP